jgi:tripartite-type tricarboxylate transporter receptor subunit TctC
MPNRRDIIKGAAALPLALGGASLFPESVSAQAYPTKTVTIIAPFPPGGVADYAARPLAAYLTEKFPHPVVVENKAGAGGGVGHAFVARAAPDGHTLMTALPSLAVIPEANRIQKLPVTYEASDFVPLARMFADAVVLAVKTIRTLREGRHSTRLYGRSRVREVPRGGHSPAPWRNAQG